MENQNTQNNLPNSEWKKCHHHESGAGRYFFGLMLIFFGVVYLLKTLGYDINIPWKKELVWPVVLIFLGLSFLVRGKAASALTGLLVGLGVITILLHILTGGTVWSQLK